MAVLSCRDYLRKNENIPIIMIHNHVFRHTYVFIIAARYGAHFPTATKTREKVPGTLLKLFRFPLELSLSFKNERWRQSHQRNGRRTLGSRREL